LIEINIAIGKYGNDHIDVVIEDNKIYGMYHSENDSFGVTKDYIINVAAYEELEKYCNLRDIGLCED